MRLHVFNSLSFGVSVYEADLVLYFIPNGENFPLSFVDHLEVRVNLVRSEIVDINEALRLLDPHKLYKAGLQESWYGD
jgi:hypothetical protein